MRNPFRALFGLLERRSISAPADLLQAIWARHVSVAGQPVTEATALNVSAVMACVSLRARALASLPVRVYERLDERSKRPARTHPITRVLAQPNMWQTRAELFGMLEAHRVLRGNAYAWINRVPRQSPDGEERDQVVELIPMHPDQVEVPDDYDDLGPVAIYKLHRRRGGVVEIPAGDVLHLKGLSTDGRKGRSVLQDAREMIGVALATQEHAAAFWSNDATPSVALTHPKTLSEQARKHLRESWEAVYGRSKEKSRTAILEEGMQIQQLGLSERDNQFLETRAFQRAEIASWFHVPPHMIGDTEKSTSWGTGIEQQQIGFLVFTLRPDLVLWEQRLTRDLIRNRERYFIEFSLDGLLRGDAIARSTFYWRMIQMGAMSPNEVRALENMNPIEEGDIYLQPVNMAPLGSERV